MKILQTESCPLNIMSMLLKLSVLVSQVLMPTIYAYSNISVSIDGSYTALRGTVYVSIDGGESKKMCADNHDWELASVVCHQLGHGPPTMATTAYSDASFDYYYGPQVFPCKGVEKALSHCYDSTYLYVNSIYCSNHFLEVECLPSYSYDYDIRLVSETDGGNSGTVLVFYDGRWGPICGYDEHLLDVICKELGYPSHTDYTTFGGEEVIFEDPVLSIDGCNSWDTPIQHCDYSKRSSWSSDYCLTVTVNCNQYNTSHTDDSASSAAAGFSVAFFFLIIMCCTGVICCVLCKKKSSRSSREPVAMTNLTSGATVPLQSQEPVVHPPPPPYKDVVGPTSEGPPPPVYHPNMGYPPATGYPTAPGPGYPTAPGPGHPTAPGPGYPTAGIGYPTAPGPGYPTAPGPGYPPVSGTGYPAASTGYSPASGSGYPPAPGPGYPTMPGPGYPTVSDPGNLPPKSSGYLPGSGPEYQSGPPPSSAPVADDSSRMAHTDGGPPAGGQGGPAPSAPPSDFPSASE